MSSTNAKRKMCIRDSSKANPDMAGYGYQIWVDSRENAFSLRGACGQICTCLLYTSRCV